MRDVESLLKAEFLPARAKLLELAATLDRLDRATPATGWAGEQREQIEQLRHAIDILGCRDTTADTPGDDDRARRLQLLFSRPYDSDWRQQFGLAPDQPSSPDQPSAPDQPSSPDQPSAPDQPSSKA